MSAHDVYDVPPPRGPADLSGTELQALLQREKPSEATRSAVPPELSSRGLSPATAAPVPATPPDYAFGADRFAENPYQTAQAAAPPDSTASLWSRTTGALWWVHTGLLAPVALRAIYVAVFFDRPVCRQPASS